MLGELILILFAILAVFAIGVVVVTLSRLNHWNRTYDRLGKRYAGKKGNKGGAISGFLVTKPSLKFNYGRTFCSLRNRKAFGFSTGRATEISMIWPNRKLKLEISTAPQKNRSWGPGAMKEVVVDDSAFQSDYYVSASEPRQAERLLTANVRWQVEQLRRLMGNAELNISIKAGHLVVGKPGYIKDYVLLEDFVRLSLELFDRLMLVDAEGIEFVNTDQASVVDDVKCPICSEEIMHNMVVCGRCKTPHCRDCWQYNGQCATFACCETRCLQVDSVS